MSVGDWIPTTSGLRGGYRLAYLAESSGAMPQIAGARMSYDATGKLTCTWEVLLTLSLPPRA